MNTHYKALEFYKIIDKLQEYAVSDGARRTLGGLEPFLSETACRRAMEETTAARRLLDASGAPPLAAMSGLEERLTLAEAGAMLSPEELAGVAQFAVSCKRLAAYLRRGESLGGTVAVYGRGLEDLTVLDAEIGRCVDGERVRDEASSELRSLRRKLEHVEGQIKEKLNHILQSRKQYLADGYITKRAGRYVLPVQKKYQSQFEGSVVEASGKGSTVFMEPAAVSRLQAELDGLGVEEDAEVRRVLYTLTALVAEQTDSLRRNMETVEALDFLFAKARLSAALGAGPVEVGAVRRLDIRRGRHPLLDPERCVPLDFALNEGDAGVVITGPNTGGKTVAVKTVGLLTLMAQCGLHIPCGEGSYIAMQDGFWCDIGDSQDISQNLSTFSGHLTNVIGILEGASRDSLVLLDELGSGTDPAEGMGIAVAVLEELRRRGCMYLVTTHYAQVKTYAMQAPGVLTARMAFDEESLRPLYRLEMGKAGESCALHIAKRLGLAPHLLARARWEVYGGPEPESAGMAAPKSRLVREVPKREGADLADKFHLGDSVEVLPGGEMGIVYRPADAEGNVIIQVKGEKHSVKHNRIRLRVAASELYPPDYDFSIIFDSVERRKAHRQMGRKFVPGLTVTYAPDEL